MSTLTLNNMSSISNINLNDPYYVHSFLNNNLIFDFYTYNRNSLLRTLCPKIIDCLYSNLISGKDRSIYIYYLKLLLCNFISAYINDTSVSIPRNKNVYSTPKYKYIKYDTFIKLLDVLYNNGYIEYKKGFYCRNKKNSRISRYWATEKLTKYFTLENIENISLKSGYIPPIILRDKGHNDINLIGKRTPPLLRQRLDRINKVIKQNKISFTSENGKVMKLKPYLSAIFCNDSWKQGGRLYDKTPLVYSYQRVKNKKNKQRKTIKINNNETVELDYSGLHVNMLYAKEGIQLSPKDYPYSFLGDSDKKIKYAKLFLLVIINCNEEHIEDLYKTKWRRETYMTAKQAHSQIEKYFFSGEGIFLQNKDGKMSLQIVSHFAQKGIVCLPVHDSYIVEKQYKDELRQVMHDVYKKYNNGFTCNIDEK